MSQPDLFDPVAKEPELPEVQIVLFPGNRLIGRVRHVADKIMTMEPDADDVEFYWRQHVAGAYARRMKKIGASDDLICREVEHLRQRVVQELRERGYYLRSSETGGAS